MEYTAYRQKLTETGVIGALIFVSAQLAIGFFIREAFEISVSRYSAADPNDYFIYAGLSGVAAFVGLIMILIGREHYPVQKDNK